MNKTKRYSPETRERAVRLVWEAEADHGSQWSAIRSIAEKVDCTAESLRRWVRQAERDTGRRAGTTSAERDRIITFDGGANNSKLWKLVDPEWVG